MKIYLFSSFSKTINLLKIICNFRSDTTIRSVAPSPPRVSYATILTFATNRSIKLHDNSATTTYSYYRNLREKSTPSKSISKRLIHGRRLGSSSVRSEPASTACVHTVAQNAFRSAKVGVATQRLLRTDSLRRRLLAHSMYWPAKKRTYCTRI